MNVKVIYGAGPGEKIAEDVYIPKVGQTETFPGTDHKGVVRRVKRTPKEGPPRRVEIDITTKPLRKGRPFRALPGLIPDDDPATDAAGEEA